MSNVDWSLIMQDAYAIRDLRKVAHVQPYLHDSSKTPTMQPLILGLQDQSMLEMCEKLSLHNSWTIDSTVKTNQFGLPLYIVVAPKPWELGSCYGT